MEPSGSNTDIALMSLTSRDHFSTTPEPTTSSVAIGKRKAFEHEDEITKVHREPPYFIEKDHKRTRLLSPGSENEIEDFLLDDRLGTTERHISGPSNVNNAPRIRADPDRPQAEDHSPFRFPFTFIFPRAQVEDNEQSNQSDMIRSPTEQAAQTAPSSPLTSSDELYASNYNLVDALTNEPNPIETTKSPEDDPFVVFETMRSTNESETITGALLNPTSGVQTPLTAVSNTVEAPLNQTSAQYIQDITFDVTQVLLNQTQNVVSDVPEAPPNQTSDTHSLQNITITSDITPNPQIDVEAVQSSDPAPIADDDLPMDVPNPATDHVETGRPGAEENVTEPLIPPQEEPAVPFAAGGSILELSPGDVVTILNHMGEATASMIGMGADVKALRELFEQIQGKPSTRRRTATAPREDPDDGDTADDESDTPRQPRRWKRPRKRSRADNMFHKSIQCYYRELMGRHSSSELFDIERLPSEYEVASYDPQAGECCDADTFKPDLRGKISSAWNSSVLRVFVSNYMTSEWCVEDDEDRVHHHAETHLQHLISRFRIQRRSPQYRKALARKHAREERKRALLLRRIDAASKYPDLRCHIPMLERLGVNGMSSDEEDQFHGTKQYRAFPKRWRGPELTPWLRVFDAAYRKARLAPFEQGQGAMPRLRCTSNVQPPRPLGKAVRGLPKNAYDPDWVASLSSYERRRLNMTDETYQFRHSVEAMLLSQEYSGGVDPGLEYI